MKPIKATKKGDTDTICVIAGTKLKDEHSECLSKCPKMAGLEGMGRTIHNCGNLKIDTTKNIVLRTYDTRIENKTVPMEFFLRLSDTKVKRTIQSLTLSWDYRAPKHQSHVIELRLEHESLETIQNPAPLHFKLIENELKASNDDNVDKVRL